MTDSALHANSPLVSVIIPVYNAAHFLIAALRSVFAQDYPHYEVIVIDDGSTDDLLDVVREFPAIRLLRQHNQGPAVARNLGVANASGSMIAFLDADDMWRPAKLTAQVNYLLAHPHDGYVICHLHALTVPGVEISPVFNKLHWQDDPIASIPSALLVRREIMASVGPFDPQLRAAEDFDWFARANDCGISAGIVDTVLFDKRLHNNNLSLDVALNHRNMFRALQNSIQRKRKHPQPLSEDTCITSAAR